MVLGTFTTARVVAQRVGGCLEGVPRLRRVVAADDEPVADVVAVQVLEDGGYIAIAQLAPRRTDDGSRRVGYGLPLRLGYGRQVYLPAFQHSFEAARRSVQDASRHGARELGRDAVETAVQDVRAAAGLHRQSVGAGHVPI